MQDVVSCGWLAVGWSAPRRVGNEKALGTVSGRPGRRRMETASNAKCEGVVSELCHVM